MFKKSTVDEILDFAIEQEERDSMFYFDLAKKMNRLWMKTIFEQFAGEELGHKAKLQAIKDKKLLVPATEKVQDLKISDYLIDITYTPNMGYQEALILAMKKEKAAFRLYSDLALKTDDENLRNGLLMLAQEEAKHKLRFEVEYDEYILKDN